MALLGLPTFPFGQELAEELQKARQVDFVLAAVDRQADVPGLPRPWPVGGQENLDRTIGSEDGAVLPCTQDFFGYYILGNVKDSSLAEIWNNDKMITLRKKILDGDIADLETCSGCDRLWREQFLGIPREYLWKFLLKRMP